jgi:MFS family permease
LIVFVASLGGAISFAALVGGPVPAVHDEFSYLLAADTYARGRLTNPAHPMWEHFVSPHVIQRPTYASKYQPAPGAALALGQVVAGDPVWGLWMSVALMSVAVTWMLQGWLPARWALVGGLLTVLQFGIGGTWAQSFWGGAVPAGAAALVFGALAPGRRGSWAGALALAAGSALLALSRPFEGFLVFALALGFLLLGSDGLRGPGLRRTLAVLAGTGLLGGAFMLHLNERVTGDPFTMPYAQHAALQDAVPLFVFQELPAEPAYVDERLRRFHTEWEMEWYVSQRTKSARIAGALARPLVAGIDFLFGPPRNSPGSRPWIPSALLLPFLLVPHLLRRREARLALGACAGVFLALPLVTYFLPHYVAVLAGAWMLLVVESLRVLRAILRRHGLSRAVVPVAMVLSLILLVQAGLRQRTLLDPTDSWSLQRLELAGTLEEGGGEHLVLVEYAPDYSLHAEWVYNSAEIDGQAVVWARSLGPEKDASLLEYFQGRQAWRLWLEPDSAPRIRPATASAP